MTINEEQDSNPAPDVSNVYTFSEGIAPTEAQISAAVAFVASHTAFTGIPEDERIVDVVKLVEYGIKTSERVPDKDDVEVSMLIGLSTANVRALARRRAGDVEIEYSIQPPEPKTDAPA